MLVNSLMSSLKFTAKLHLKTPFFDQRMFLQHDPAFQAPGFYEKCGFITEFVRKNLKNPKLTKTFFVKYFDGGAQTQGILHHTSD